MSESIGIIGAGHLATYTVAGLRNAGDRRTILVSPRNAGVAQQLAEKYGCRIARSNQDVLDQADTVLLAVRPDAVADALASCQFNAQHLLISCVAGVAIDQLQQAKPATLVRAMPLSAAEFGAGAIPLYPPNDRASQLFGQIGRVAALGSEAQFEQATVIACYNGWLLQLFATLSGWLVAQNVAPALARELVLEASKGAAELALNKPEQSLEALLTGIATEGTLTKKGLDRLQRDNAFPPWRDAADELMAVLSHKASR